MCCQVQKLFFVHVSMDLGAFCVQNRNQLNKEHRGFYFCDQLDLHFPVPQDVKHNTAPICSTAGEWRDFSNLRSTRYTITGLTESETNPACLQQKWFFLIRDLLLPQRLIITQQNSIRLRIKKTFSGSQKFEIQSMHISGMDVIITMETAVNALQLPARHAKQV